MTDILIPPWLRVSSQRVDAVSNTAIARSIFTGAASTVQRGGDRLRFGIRTDNASNRNGNIERAILMALRTQARGQGNRIWYSPYGYSPRGSFPATELLSNNTFASGTTGWTGTNSSLTVTDRNLRSTRISNSLNENDLSQSVSGLSAYNTYVLRGHVSAINGAENVAIYISGSPASIGTSPSNTTGYRSISSTISATSIIAFLYGNNVAGAKAFDFFETPWMSLSQCALVDNGPNSVTYSDQLDNAAWTKGNTTVTAEAAVDARGNNTADALFETSANNFHYALQIVPKSAVAQDWTFSVELRIGLRAFARVFIGDLSTNSASMTVNLNTGAISTGPTASGTITNARATTTSLGGSWYRFTLTARIPASVTTANGCEVDMSPDGTTFTYAGDITKYIVLGRRSYAQTAVPCTATLTTSATTTGTLQTGNSINVKGLPVSTNGLLLPGDYVQIGQQLVPVAGALNSDAAGLGTLQLAWPLRNAPADNDPVIINTPMGKFVLTENIGGWDESPGIFSSHDFVLEEALDV